MNNAFEALYTGVYIVIFITSVTIALFLFRSINEFAEDSYNYGNQATSESLIEATGETNLTLSADEVIPYYFNYVKKDIYQERSQNELNFNITIYGNNGSALANNLDYNGLRTRLGNYTYILKCTGETAGKPNFEIRRI